MMTRFALNVLWWICLVVAPLVLAAIELYHPAGFTHDPGAYQYLSAAEPHTAQHKALDYFGPAWWVTLHTIQTPMVGLVAIGLWLLTLGLIHSSDGRLAQGFAWLSAVSTFVFLIYYTSLDAIGGVGLGRTIVATERLAQGGQLTPGQVEGVAQVLNATWTDPVVGGVGSVISLTGSWAVFLAALFAALALLVARRAPWPALLLLVAFGWELQLTHAMPHGPIAFGLLALASLWIWVARRRRGALRDGKVAPAFASRI